MKINLRSRRFHDPWGSTFGNRYGSIGKFCFMMSKSDCNGEDSYYENSGKPIDYKCVHADITLAYEGFSYKYVKTGKRNPMRLRR